MGIIVRATRDFTVGPSREIVIRKGDMRNVELEKDGRFTTHTSPFTGGAQFFGWCRIGDGWEAIP